MEERELEGRNGCFCRPQVLVKVLLKFDPPKKTGGVSSDWEGGTCDMIFSRHFYLHLTVVRVSLHPLVFAVKQQMFDKRFQVLVMRFQDKLQGR